MNIKYIAKKENMANNISGTKMTVGENAVVSLDSTWCDVNKNSPFSRIYFILDGSGEITVNGEKVFLQPGNVYFIPIGSDMEYRCDEQLVKLYFHINLIDCNGFDVFDGMKNTVIVKKGMEYVRSVVEAYSENTYTALLQLKRCLYEIIERASTEGGIAEKQLVSYSYHVACAMDYIKNNLSIKLDNSSIAQKLFVSESFLSKRFKAEVGITIGQYIDKLVFFSAQQQLLNRELSIHEISTSLGFCDQFYFSRRFRQFFGCSPAVYRKYYISGSVNNTIL